MKRKISIILSALLSALTFCSCGSTAVNPNNPNSTNTPDSAASGNSSTVSDSITETADSPNGDVMQRLSLFSGELFLACSGESNDNTIISPLSVYTALAMVNNGANGNTQSEITDVLSAYIQRKYAILCYAEHNPLSVADINSAMHSYIEDSNNGELLSIANAIFAAKRNGQTLSDSFTSTAKNDYFAEIFNTELNNKTVSKINSWASKNTKGMIPEIIRETDIDPNTAAVLLNAVSFEAQWASPYDEFSVNEGEFTNYDGTKSDCTYLTSTEHTYLKSDHATGFMKYYSKDENDHHYSFAAILPNKETDINTFINEYSAFEIPEMLESQEQCDVDTKLPKFSFDSEFKLKEILGYMGIHDAFDVNKADFSNFTEGGNDISIGEVIHKAHIDVDEAVTKAAAVTAVTMTDNAMQLEEEKPKEVFLDRPFVFMIYDNTENVPVFYGAAKVIGD